MSDSPRVNHGRSAAAADAYGKDSKMDFGKAAVNRLLHEFKGTLNSTLPAAIRAAGLDPWTPVAPNTVALPEIDLGICRAKVKATFPITSVTGLSCLVIDTLEADKVNVEGLPPTLSATMTLTAAAHLASDLAGTVGGDLSASCEGKSKSLKLSGTVAAKGVKTSGTGTGSASGKAKIVPPKIKRCVNGLKIDTLSIDYTSIKVSIGDLGFFNSILQDLVDAISDHFGQKITSDISSQMPPVVNGLIASHLPFCKTDSVRLRP